VLVKAIHTQGPEWIVARGGVFPDPEFPVLAVDFKNWPAVHVNNPRCLWVCGFPDSLPALAYFADVD